MLSFNLKGIDIEIYNYNILLLTVYFIKNPLFFIYNLYPELRFNSSKFDF